MFAYLVVTDDPDHYLRADEYHLYHDGAQLINGRGSELVIRNNPNATDPSYEELLEFVLTDETNRCKYSDPFFMCGDFSQVVHTNAENGGIRCGMVLIEYENDDELHMLNVFNTTDKGIIYIDCIEYDARVVLEIGNVPEYYYLYNDDWLVSSWDIKVSGVTIYW